MQRTEMKTPSFCNPHSLCSNTEIGGAGVAATVCGPFENMGVFSQTPVRSCSVIPPSLSIMHDSTRAMPVLSQGCSQNLSSLPDLLVTHPLAAPWLLRRCFSTYGLTMA